MNDATVSVVIPVRDGAATIGDALDALETQRYDGPYEVIVVDDQSSDATREIAERSPVVTRVIGLDGVGPGRARNAGAAVARGPRIAFLDADCQPTPMWLQAGVRALEHAELVIGETQPRPDRELGAFDRTLGVSGCTPLFESANLFVRRELFQRLGGFESWLGPRGGKELGEDVWFGWRAVRAGARIAACPEALVHHEVFPRGPAQFAAERWRLRYFPAMARRMPELRRALFHRRIFLTARQARFDAAVLGLSLAALTRRPLLGAAAIPYVQTLARDLREGPKLPPARVAADAVSLTALLLGSVRSRTILL